MKEIQVIKDNQGHVRGRLYEDFPPGDQKLYDKGGHVLGRYTKAVNSTYKTNGQRISYGNTLLTLLPIS